MWKAVILAGGRATRLGGIDKCALRNEAGESLLQLALQACRPAAMTVVVGEARMGATDTAALRVVREAPEYGGPVAALAAGLAAVDDVPAEWTALVAADLTGIRDALPVLLDRAADADGATDAAIAVDPDGRTQWLLALYRTAALRRRLTAMDAGRPLEGASLRALLAGIPATTVPLPAHLCADIDTIEDARAAGLALSEVAHA